MYTLPQPAPAHDTFQLFLPCDLRVLHPYDDTFRQAPNYTNEEMQRIGSKINVEEDAKFLLLIKCCTGELR